MPARALRRGAVVLTGAAALSVLGFSGSAQAADHNWDGVAQCESSGNWNSNTGNGYYGGLQFSASTWAAYGGRQYAPNAHQASKAQQIEIAERTLDGQGVGAWPVCGRHLTGAATSTSTAAAAPERASRAERAAPASSGTHVVRSGDTLGAIAARYGTAGGWQAVYAANRNQISNPDLIRVGQVLQLP